MAKMNNVHRMKIKRAHNKRARDIYLQKAKKCEKVIKELSKRIDKEENLIGSDKK